MIFLGSAGVFIGLLGLFLFRGFDHDHNIGNEIVEQKKNDFVRSVYTTLRNLDTNTENVENPLMEQTSISSPQTIVVPELAVTESTTSINEQRKKHFANNLFFDFYMLVIIELFEFVVKQLITFFLLND